MKKRIMLAIATMLVLGLTIAAFAYNTTNSGTKTTKNCCSKDKDSCPLKSKTDSAEKHDCDNKDDCCKKDADSCPMKKQAETSSQTVDMKNVTVATSAEDCCKNGGSACCKKKS